MKRHWQLQFGNNKFGCHSWVGSVGITIIINTSQGVGHVVEFGFVALASSDNKIDRAPAFLDCFMYAATLWKVTAKVAAQKTKCRVT